MLTVFKIFFWFLVCLVILFAFATQIIQIGFPSEYNYGSWIVGVEPPTMVYCLGRSVPNEHREPEGGFSLCYGVSVTLPFRF